MLCVSFGTTRSVIMQPSLTTSFAFYGSDGL